MLENLNPLSSGLGSLNFLGAASTATLDPLSQLKSLFSGAFAGGNGQGFSRVSSSAGSVGGALSCGDACCQKTESLGF